jgi:hypothetical protein
MSIVNAIADGRCQESHYGDSRFLVIQLNLGKNSLENAPNSNEMADL